MYVQKQLRKTSQNTSANLVYSHLKTHASAVERSVFGLHPVSSGEFLLA